MAILGRLQPNRPIIRRSPTGALPDPGAVLDIGTSRGQHFLLQYAQTGAGSTDTATQADIAAGFTINPYFTTTADGQRVQFWARLDAPVLGASSTSRAELREVNADGTDALWDANIGYREFRAKITPTHLPSVTPAAVFLQMFDTVAAADRISFRTQLVSGTARLRWRINGSTVAMDATSPINPGSNDLATGVGNIVGVEWDVKIVLAAGAISIYVNDMVTPVITRAAGTLAANGVSAYWKTGCYNQASTATGDAGTDWGSSELRSLAVVRTDGAVEGGPAVAAAAGSATVSTKRTGAGSGAAVAIVGSAARKVAAVSGSCSAVTAGTATATKRAPSAGAGAAIAVPTGRAVKVMAHTGAGVAAAGGSGRAVKAVPGTGGAIAVASGQGVESTQLAPGPPPRIVVVTAQPSRRFRDVGSIQISASIVLVPGTAENGAAVGAAVGTALPRKVAAVAGSCVASGTATATPRKSAAPAGACVATATGSGTAGKRASQAGPGVGCGASSGRAAKSTATSGVSVATGAGRGTTAKVATPTGRAIAIASGSGAETRRAAQSGAVTAAACPSGVAGKRCAVAGVSVGSAASSSQTVRVARPVGQAVAVSSVSGRAGKRAAGVGGAVGSGFGSGLSRKVVGAAGPAVSAAVAIGRAGKRTACTGSTFGI